MKYTVLELISALEAFEDTARVSAWSGCHDCGGDDLKVEYDEEHGVSIVGWMDPFPETVGDF